MTTARDFITLALKEAGISGVGQTPLSEDINDCFTLLHRMLARWQKKRWMVPYLYEVVALGNNLRSNLIGPGQYYNSLRPDKIQAAYFKQLVSSDFGPSFGTSFGNGNLGSNDVSFRLDPIWSYEDYALLALKDLNAWPQFFFYDGKYPYGNVYIWPIPSSIYEIHLVVKGAIGFATMISTLEILNGGVGYVNGQYNNVPLITVTGVGSGATADITISGSAITVAVINTNDADNPGEFYNVGDLLTIPNTSIGGTGVGLSLSVSGVTDSLDSVFNMPEEYEDAIHYNLVKRIIMHYQYPLQPELVKEAKLSLNTIKIANAQIPTLQMPPELRNVRSNNFYIFNADAR